MSKKLAVKGRRILQHKASTKVPPFNIMDYNMSMISALNYYSREVENKDKKSHALAYWKKQGKDTSKVSKLHESWFSTVGAVAHMATNNVPLNDHDLARLDSAYYQLFDMKEEEEVVEQTTTGAPKLSIQDHMNNAAKVHIAEVEGMIDVIMTTGDVADIKQYVTANQIKGPVLKRVGEWSSKKLNEYKSVLNDPELLEGYGNLGKRGMNKLVSFMDTVATTCNTAATIARTLRAPRVRKEKPPSVLVAKMKWMREFVDLKLKSVFPEKIIGADTLYMFDVAKRRLQKYVALDGYMLSVKANTIMNWDPTKSSSKLIRKPEVQLTGIQNMGKRPMAGFFNDVKSTEGKVNGRSNDNLIIVSVF